MALSREEIGEIATKTADEVVSRLKQQREDCELRDFIIGSAMGSGAIPLYGRETRKEPCSGCRIDLDKPLESGNVMATTEGAIGTLSAREVREWCSEIIEVADGRCERARTIREAARECKEKHPDDTEAFFRCYIPAFSQITKESNPGTPYQEEGERIARQLGNGVIYNGPQMHHDKLYAHLFTDAAVTGTTFACLGLEECKAKLIQKRKDFGAAPPTFS